MTTQTAEDQTTSGQTVDGAPRIDEWVTLTDAAAMLGISRQATHARVQAGKFKTTHILGHERPMIVLKRSEVEALVAGSAD